MSFGDPFDLGEEIAETICSVVGQLRRRRGGIPLIPVAMQRLEMF